MTKGTEYYLYLGHAVRERLVREPGLTSAERRCLERLAAFEGTREDAEQLAAACDRLRLGVEASCIREMLDERSGDGCDVERAFDAVRKEHSFATSRNPAFSSPHEAYAVLLEEVDELWAEIKKKPSQADRRKMWNEAKQVAAMALRIMIEVGEPGDGEGGA